MSKLFKAQTQIISVVLIMGLAVGVIGASYLWGAPLIEKSQTENSLSQAEKNIELINSMITDVVKTGGQKTKQIQFDGELEIFDINTGENSIIYTIQGKTAGVASTNWVLLNDDLPVKSKETYAVNATDASDTISIGCEDCMMNSTGLSSSIVISNVTGTCNVAGTYTEENTFTCNSNNYVVEHVDITGTIDGFAVLRGPEYDIAGIVGTNKAGVITAKTMAATGIYLTSYKLTFRELVDPTNKEGIKILLETQGNNKVTEGMHTIKVSRADTTTENYGSSLSGELSKISVLVTLE
ncbi:hypothetical protein GQ473_03590 [archaeon]|nr:hypothetical protein [archaeon]